MPIEKRSQAQYAQDIRDGINDRANDIDTAYGPVPDTAIEPQSAVFEAQNDRVRKLSLLLTLANAAEFEGFETDLEGIAFNEGTTRNLGSGSSATVTFFRTTAPVSDAIVQRGFPIGSQADESTGTTVTFVTSEARTLPAASASSFFNIQTQRFELTVPVISVVEGSSTRVGPNRIVRPLRPLVAFDNVTNLASATGGRDVETNAELIERILLGIIGRQLGTPNGIDRFVRSEFADVSSMKTVFGSNPLLTRAATDAGAVDVFIKGSSPLQQAENQTFLGTGQTLAVSTPPLVEIVSVQSGANTYIEGSDFEVVVDSSGNGRSIRETAGIKFLPGGPTALPAVGGVVTLTYTFDNLIRALQSDTTTDDVLELGRDLLYRRGIDVPIVLTARLRVSSGFSATVVQTAVTAALLAFIDTLPLGSDVEASDLQAVVRAISGVDNFIIDRLTRSTVLTGTSDLAIEDNEFATLDSTNLTITLI